MLLSDGKRQLFTFIFDSYLHSFGIYLDQFIPMATFRANPGWLDWWTVFFWGWFLGYGPLMAMFVARISRGRTIREMILLISVVAPVITCFWFTIVGGSVNLGIDTVFTGVSTNLNNRTYYLGQTFTDGVSKPESQKYSGNIIFLDNRPSVTRSSSQKEDVKIILQF